MIASEYAYAKLWGNIVNQSFSMAKCNCIACNNCGCHPRCMISEWEDILW